MNLFYKTVFIITAFLFSSCLINRQRQVWFGALQQTHLADTGNVVRIYFDKQGNLYPAKKLFIPYKNFFDPHKGKKTISENPHSGNLEYFYTTNKQGLKELSSYYTLNGTAITSAKDSFYAVQQVIRKKIIEQLNSINSGEILKSIIVMIHGFNDNDPTGDYQLMRDAIRNNGYEKGRFIYLEVFWDGLTTNQGNPVYENIWKRALQNSAYVSLGLRQILSHVDHSIQIRIITHSLGASIGTGALFNTETKWNRNGFRKVGKKLKADFGMNYFDEQKSISTPMNNIRLGMIAPAIPGYITFTDFNNRSRDISISENNINKIVVGYNENDFAVTKRFLNMDLARYFGSTSLGCNYKRKGKTEIEKCYTALIKNGYSDEMSHQLIRPVDFSQYKKRKKDEEHGLYYYLLNTEKTKEFLKELFE